MLWVRLSRSCHSANGRYQRVSLVAPRPGEGPLTEPVAGTRVGRPELGQGAHLTAWQPAGERPVLFTSPNSAFAPGRAIRGGIPIVFQWFGANRREPAAPQHGFARTAPWRLDRVETAGRESLTLTLAISDGGVGSPV